MKDSEIGNNEEVMYEILKRRGNVHGISFAEFITAAREVIAGIPLGVITPIEDLIGHLELTVLRNRLLN